MLMGSIVKKRKPDLRHFAAILATAVFILSFKHSSEVAQGFCTGSDFVVRKLLPSLFPFLFLSEMLLHTGALDTISRTVSPVMKKLRLNPGITAPCILGLVCGIPLGAKCIKDHYERGYISKAEADRLLAACNCASPAFVICAVGGAMLSDARTGRILWSVSVVISLAISLFLMPKSTEKHTHIHRQPATEKFVFSEAFTSSMKNAASSMINIGFLVALFYSFSSIIYDVLLSMGTSPGLCAVICSVIEFSNGCITASQLEAVSVPVCAFSVGFCGICAYFQVRSEAHPCADMKYYLLTKVLCGMLSALFAYFLL